MDISQIIGNQKIQKGDLCSFKREYYKGLQKDRIWHVIGLLDSYVVGTHTLQAKVHYKLINCIEITNTVSENNKTIGGIIFNRLNLLRLHDGMAGDFQKASQRDLSLWNLHNMK
jgi:hypothetical protein